MKKLVQPTELAKASQMRPDDPRITLLTEVSGLKKLERIYNDVDGLEDLEFVDAIFRNLDLHLDVDGKDLDQLPRSGPLVFVANHPYGAIDGLALVQVLGKLRPDLKVLANFLLQQVEPLRHRFLAVNPFEDVKSRSSFQGTRAAMAHVAAGGALGIFPAGEVSSWQTELRSVADRRWRTSAIKLIRSTGAPVIPVWFDGTNSFIFHMLGMIHPNLRTLTLPKEMLRMRGRSVRIRVGHPISAKDIAAFRNVEQLGRYLRAKTYALGSGVQVRREQFRPLRFPRKPKPVMDAEPIEVLRKEIASVQDLKRSSQGEFDLFLAPSERIPHMLREIGRQRELTFRAVGEGTNKRIDLDEFDLYYDHLFLWDREKERLAGAYRVGNGTRIMERYGKRGFYTHTLFRMGRPMEKVLGKSFELGRSFVSADYQRHRLPLYLLWRGLLLHIMANPDHQYLIGPVSISSTYSRFSRGLIMEFVKQHHYDHELAKHVRPRNRFVIKSDKADSNALLGSASDIKKLDKLIDDIEPKETAVPILLKKYLMLNARIIGFNSDPHFNDSLDGLIVLDLTRVPERTIEDLKRGMAEAMGIKGA